MSYVSAERVGDDVLIWERTEHGRELLVRPAPYYFYATDPEGKFTSLYGDKLSRFDFASSREFYLAKKKFKENDYELFESDIPPEIKYLSEHYYNVKAPKLNVTLYDIEVDYDPEIGHASTTNPYAPINAIALVHMWNNRCVVMAVPPNFAPAKANDDKWEQGLAPDDFMQRMEEIAPLDPELDVEILFFESEEDMLKVFLEEIQDSDLIAGWNSDLFDNPYVAKRVERLGKKYFRRLSFDQAPDPKFKTVEVMKREEEIVEFGGRIGADLMILFKKYEMEERPTYRLAAISDEILPDLAKLEYPGSLASLYRNDFAWFVRYNIRDTEILKGLEERLGYIELANQMMHLSTGVWKNVVGTLKLAEYAVVNYCHNELDNLIVNDFHHQDVYGKIQGAFVLLPQIGLQENVGSIDINSLYPSAIRAINMSPETLMGQFVDKTKAAEEIAKGSEVILPCMFDEATQVPETLRGQVYRYTAAKWRDFFQNLGWAISGYGTVFSQKKQGVIPMILEDWYAMRKKYQKLKGEADDKIMKTYYDKLQYTYKIKLNAFYGALTNQYFRFFDQRLGESTTGTGRMILLHQCAKTCELLDGEYVMPDREELDKEGKLHIGYSDKWSVVYGDTDSTYFATHAKDVDDAVKVADLIGEKVNDSFQEFMADTFLATEGYNDKIKCGRENVSDRGIFVNKKMYILHINDSEGDKVDKMKVMGLQTKKTTLPKEVRIVLNKFVERYLKGEDWNVLAEEIVAYKDKLEAVDDIMYLGLPTGIKKVEAYEADYNQNPSVHLPGHVAASVFYNQCLKDFKDNESLRIMTGMKIKVFKFKKKMNMGRFTSIAVPVDLEEIPEWFKKNFEEHIDRKAHIERLVDKPLEKIFHAIGKEPPTKQQLLIDDLLSF